MKRIYTLLFNLTLISSYSVAKPTKVDNKYEDNQKNGSLKNIPSKKVDYSIQPGDTLLAIARKHYTTRAEIRELNQMTEGERLKIGRVLKIKTNTFYPKGAIVDYKIQRGDTLYKIAKKYSTTTDEIKKLNGIGKKVTLRQGKMLKVPTNTYLLNKSDTAKEKEKLSLPKDVKIVDYAIKSGDTLFKIGRKHKSTSREIRELNNLAYGESLKIGRVLKVPLNTYIPDEKNETVTIASVIEEESKKVASTLKEEKSEVAKVVEKNAVTIAKEKEEALKKELARLKTEEEAILAKADAIRKERLLRAEAIEKARVAREEAEKQRKIAEAKEKARKVAEAKKAAEEKAKQEQEREEALKKELAAKKAAAEKAKKARMEAEAKEKARVAKIKAAMDAEVKRVMAEIEAEAKERTKIAKQKAEERIKAETAKKIEEAKAKLMQEAEAKTKKTSPAVEKKIEETKEKKTSEAKKPTEDKVKVAKEETTNKNPDVFITKNNQIAEYTVKSGDNLYKIAKAHHTTTKEVLEANKFRSNSDLVIGKAIKVPVDTYFHLKDYTIKRGDTLYAIARKHNTTTTRVLLANNMNRRDRLSVGKVLRVPVDTFSLERDTDTVRVATTKVKEKKSIEVATKNLKTKNHKIKRGDTLYSIARNNDTTVKKLKQLNSIKATKELKIGQNILIPSSNYKSPVRLVSNQNTTKVKKREVKKLTIEAPEEKQSFASLLNSLGSSSKQKALPKTAKKHLGKKYVWGATGPYKFDCSGFTSYVCKKNGVCIPRTSINQSKVGTYVSRSNLKAGDLIFFDTSKRRKGYVNHVGIYIGNNKFIHASSAKKKVVVTSLNKPFYKSRFKWGRRVDM